MCGSQNVSGPEMAGPGVGAAQAAAAATSQGTGGKGTAGHGPPAPEQSVASSQAAETADPKEQIAYLLRLGLNRREVCVDTCHSNVLLSFLLLHIHGSLPRPDERMCIRPQVMGVLKSMAESIDPRAPMLVIKYATFKEHGCIPRSSDEKTVPLSKLPADIKVRRLFFPIYCHTCAGPTLLSLSHAFLARRRDPTAPDLCERLLARRRLCSSRTGGFDRGTPGRSARRMATSGRARRIPTTRRLPSTGSSATE